MSVKERIRKYEWVIIPAVLIVAAWFSGDYHGQKKILASLESKQDTVVKVVTVYKDFPNPAKTAQIGYIPIPTYKFLSDTVSQEIPVFVHDTTTTVIYLPREQAYYEEEDGALRLWVSGYEPRLDRYELDAKTVTITNTVSEKASRWGISVNCGYGAAMAGKTVVLSPYLGVGISYTFIRF